MRSAHRVRLLAAAVAAALPLLPAASSAQGIDWQLQWNLRARYEHVDDAAFARDADAATLRLRAGLHARYGEHWEALVEGDAIESGSCAHASQGR